MTKEEKELLQSASIEIKSLRRYNEILTARTNMFDDMMLLIRTAPNYGSAGMTEDVAWKIDKHLASVEK